MRLGLDEKEVRGTWKIVGARIEADENCSRIRKLTQSHLHEVARDESGWDLLYVDPSDGRYWELTYPDSHLHGGGPPKLTCISREHARSKYGSSV
jgi:hypothetical protein